MPACAITSTVLDSSRSFCFMDWGPGRRSVGPNTIARLCNDILFSPSCWLILNNNVIESEFTLLLMNAIEWWCSLTESNDRELRLLSLYLAAEGRWIWRGELRSSLTRVNCWTGWMCRKTICKMMMNVLSKMLIVQLDYWTHLLVRLIREQRLRQLP